MQLAYLFIDGHHNLHLINANLPDHKPNARQLREGAEAAARFHAAYDEGWRFAGALQNGGLMGPKWYRPDE